MLTQFKNYAVDLFETARFVGDIFSTGSINYAERACEIRGRIAETQKTDPVRTDLQRQLQILKKEYL